MRYLGLTGASLPAPAATPGSAFSGVPDGTGDSGKPGKVRIKFLVFLVLMDDLSNLLLQPKKPVLLELLGQVLEKG